jgi:purine-binding chemotaxis protein CheW
MNTEPQRDQTVPAGRDDIQRTLRQRAQLLGCPMASETCHGPSVDTVAFLLGDETYAIELSHVREVFPLRQLTPLPCTPPFVRGIVSVRGQILSILDLRRLFDMPERETVEENNVIVVHGDDMEFGLMVQSILGTRAIELEQLQPPPSPDSGTRPSYLRGVTNDRTALLDATALLSDRQLVVDHSDG